ncbi:MAG TPA: TetR/AcrR family transcriptional regulator [Spirochaetia bacterium]|nr:TetR/AcrR family transcriptional regulator [Spirochaetia bacterium]
MARLKNEKKRQTILETSKMLFSQHGFFNTSVSDIVHETGFPVGTIYTYFRNKEEIIQSIVEEGWQEFRRDLVQSVDGRNNSLDRLRIVIDVFLPRLLEDLDFINILLSEAIQYTRIEEKIDELTSIVSSIIPAAGLPFNRSQLEAGLMVYFLGILNAARIARSSSVGVTIADIMSFTRITIEQSLGVMLGPTPVKEPMSTPTSS